MMIVYSREVLESDLKRLELYVSKYIEMYAEYYNDSFPKLHYLLHIASDIRK